MWLLIFCVLNNIFLVLQILFDNVCFRGLLRKIYHCMDCRMSDVFINEVPLIFRKEIYALACIIGGIAYFICYKIGMGNIASGLMCGLFVIISRILAVHYKIHLPTLKGDNE